LRRAGGDLGGQVDHAVGVAPLVVVPADELEEVLVQLDRRAGVEDRRALVVDEVGRDDLVVGVAEDALQVGLGGLLQGGLDLLEEVSLTVRKVRSTTETSAPARGRPCR
jgi:hypothetical protein